MKFEIINKQNHEIKRVKSFEAADAFFKANDPADYRFVSEVAGITLNCTGTEFVFARRKRNRPGTKVSGNDWKQLLSEVKALQKSVHDRQMKLNAALPKPEAATEPDQGKAFEIIYSLTQ